MNTRPHVTHTLEVWSDFACFANPALKVERFSYPCPTPSAARGVFEAIYYKPAFRWQITRIELLALPAYIALRRNEVKDKASTAAIGKWIKGTAEPEPIWADADPSWTGTDMKGRTQRQTMALSNPRFRISARIIPRAHADQPAAAYNAQFVRRASQGKCAYQPYLGCKEFVAFFKWVQDIDKEPGPVDYSQNLGLMLYDVFDLDAINASVAMQEETDKKKRQVNKASVSLFRAEIVRGVLEVPDYSSDKVIKPASQRRVG